MPIQEMTAAIFAANGSIFNVSYFSEGTFTWMVGEYSSPSSGSQYIDTGMQNVFIASVWDADGDTVRMSAGANGMISICFSGMTTGLTGVFDAWGQ